MITEIKICGIVYSIFYKTPEEMEGRLGLANFNTQEIWINSGSTEQTKKIAVVHEILHMMDHAYNLKLSEEQVVFTSHAFLALLSDNSDKIRYEI
jgi:hypothetical protein